MKNQERNRGTLGGKENNFLKMHLEDQSSKFIIKANNKKNNRIKSRQDNSFIYNHIYNNFNIDLIKKKIIIK